jgi:hypothetical protein
MVCFKDLTVIQPQPELHCQFKNQLLQGEKGVFCFIRLQWDEILLFLPRYKQ